MKTRLFVLLPFAMAVSLVIALGAQSPIIPYQAKLQRIQQIISQDGSLEAGQFIQEDSFRDSEGSIYKKTRGVDSIAGQVLDTLINIVNARDGRIYLINEDKKTVLISPNPLPLMPSQLPQKGFPPNLERKEYLGRTCVVLQSPQEKGEVWVDEEMGVLLYSHRETALPDGKTMIRTIRVIELTIGQEADPHLFIPPSFDGYTVVEKAQ